MSQQDQQDLFEFLERQGDNSSLEGRKARRAVLEEVASVSESPSLSTGDKVLPGKPVQYQLYGPGYKPASHTIGTLPPDVYSVECDQNGSYVVPQRIVTDSLLRLPDSRSDEVIEEILRFWSMKEKFKQYGYSHKRGFMLYGPPGSGKTSTINVISQEMVSRGGIVVLHTAHPNVVSGILCEVRMIEPNRPIICIMEDVDAIVGRFGDHELLAMLDGELSIDNVAFIATTNYPELLDARMTNRPSRFDRVVKIDMPNADARKVYLESRNLGLAEGELGNWVEMTAGFSIAHIKELVISHRCFEIPLEEAVARMRGMLKKQPKSSDRDTGMGFQKGEY